MPDRVRARAAVTALLILLTVAGIHTMGPPGDWDKSVSHMAIVGLALEVVLAGLLITLRWHHRPAATELAGRLHRMVSTAIVAAMIGVLGAILFSLISNQPKLVNLHHAPIVRIRGKFRLHAAKAVASHFQVGPLIRDILIAIVVITILVIVLRALRNQRQRRVAQLTDLAVDEVTDEDLARAVESGRMALRDLDDARAAIIACYVAMEQSLAEAGAARGVAETPDELLARAVNAGLVSPGPAGVLTRLFYEARFSSHEMPMSQRDQAERALADIAAELPASELT